jgi:hypothetical protein
MKKQEKQQADYHGFRPAGRGLGEPLSKHPAGG